MKANPFKKDRDPKQKLYYWLTVVSLVMGILVGALTFADKIGWLGTDRVSDHLEKSIQPAKQTPSKE